MDDHAHAREGIRLILSEDSSFEVVAEAKSGPEAIALTEQYMPDIILMDIQMNGMSGLETTKRIKARYPYVKIVIVTVSDDITDLFEALKKGAQGYLLKSVNAESWNDYLKAVAIDEVPMSKELAVRMIQEFAHSEDKPVKPDHPLTAREREILGWVAKGLSNREIAANLNISENTVKNHLKNTLQKLHLENRVQLARYAYEQGFYPK